MQSAAFQSGDLVEIARRKESSGLLSLSMRLESYPMWSLQCTVNLTRGNSGLPRRAKSPKRLELVLTQCYVLQALLIQAVTGQLIFKES